MRLVPHDQNTGGFFVCVLEKEANLRSSEQSSAAAKRAASPSTPEIAREGKKVKSDPGAEAVDASLNLDQHEEVPVKEESVDTDKKEEAGKKEKRDWSYREDPFSFVDPEHAEVQLIWYVFLGSCRGMAESTVNGFKRKIVSLGVIFWSEMIEGSLFGLYTSPTPFSR